MKHYQITTLQLTQIDSLLKLHHANLKENLDAVTIKNEGFVSFRYDKDTILLKMEAAPQIVATTEGGEVVGYALATLPEVGAKIPAFSLIMELLKTLSYGGKRLNDWKYYYMGQICVAADWRGKGVFAALYQGHKDYFGKEYDFVLTEIATENTRSLAAHRRIGFQVIHTYFDEAEQKEWQIVVLHLK